jgi:hypothetical protein
MDDKVFLTPHFIRFVKIKTASFFIDEFNIPEDVIFKIDFNRTYNIIATQNIAIINLKVTYTIPSGTEVPRMVLDCVVHNVFEIENIIDFIDKKSGMVKLPLSILSSLVGLSATHARAIISVHTAGTAFGETLIPVVNPEELTKALFDEA